MYKYKYKYGFRGPETKDEVHRLIHERNGFTSQLTPPPVEGVPDKNYLFSNFYTKKNGQGNFFTLWPGQQIRNLGGWDNKIVSVYVGGINKVTLFEHPDFGGERLELQENKMYNLTDIAIGCDPFRFGCHNWADFVSSIKVEPLSEQLPEPC
jgi:hypothetical protein